MGLGAFPYEHPLHLGLIGMHGHYQCNKAAHDCDVLIVCGARFSDRVAGNRAQFAPNAEILHIDIDAAEMDKNVPSNYHLRGDLAEMLPELTEAVNKLDHTEWKNEIASFTRPFKQLQIGDYVNPQTLIEKLTQQRQTIQSLLPMSDSISFGLLSSISSDIPVHFFLRAVWVQWDIPWVPLSADRWDAPTRQL